MKSLIEESSSIAKAVEKGWERAGKPQSFSIKIFELPEKNFLGLTTKYAKVGIFFAEEKQPAHHTPKKEAHSSAPKPRRQDSHTHDKNFSADKKTRPDSAHDAADAHKTRTPKNTPQPKKEHTLRPAREKETHAAASAGKDMPPKQPNTWSDEMVNFVREWLEANPLITTQHIGFTTTAKEGQLLITFNKPLTTENAKQITLFRSFSYLIMASLKTKFKKDLKGLRVMLSCE